MSGTARWWLALAVVPVAVLVAVLGGCSAGDGHTPDDVAFAQQMIPHHRQAVAMADLAATRAASPEVRGLAARIGQGQSPEIDRMTAMLARWGAPPAGDGMSGMGGMDGMMSPDEMSRLGTLSGPAFDRAFLTMMVRHHQGAVAMARTEQERGGDPEATDLAASVVTTQEAEIGVMQALATRV